MKDKKRKNMPLKLVLAGLALILAFPCGAAITRASAAEGNTVDMSATPYYAARLAQTGAEADYFEESESKVDTAVSAQIGALTYRRRTDKTAWFSYAFDIPLTAEHFYINCYTRNTGIIYFADSDAAYAQLKSAVLNGRNDAKVENWAHYLKITQSNEQPINPVCLEKEVIGEYFSGVNTGKIYVVFADDSPSDALGLQVYEWLSFRHDAPSEFTEPTNDLVKEKQFLTGSDTSDSSIAAYEFNSTATDEKRTLVGIGNAFLSDKNIAYTEGMIIGGTVVYKIDLTDKTTTAALLGASIEITMTGSYRIAATTAKKIKTLNAETLSDKKLWNEVACGEGGTCIFDVAQFCDENNCAYVRISRGAQFSEGNSTVDAIKTTSYFKQYDETLANVSVYRLPDKKIYLTGEALDLDGSLIRVTFVSGRFIEIEMTDEMIEAFDKTAAGKKTVTASYNGLSVQFAVEYRNDFIVEIELLTVPTKTSYAFGEKLDISGGTAQLTWFSGKVETVTLDSDKVTLSGYFEKAYGKQTVCVSGDGANAFFSVNVAERQSADSSCAGALGTFYSLIALAFALALGKFIKRGI